jgi:hypothetical protein
MIPTPAVDHPEQTELAPFSQRPAVWPDHAS